MMAAQSTMNSEAVLGKFFQRVKYSAKKNKSIAKEIKSFTPSQEIPTQSKLSLSAGNQTKYSILKPINPPSSVRNILKPVQKPPVKTYSSNNFVTQTRSKVRSEPEIVKIKPVNKTRTNQVRLISRPLATNSLSLNNLNQYQA